MSGKIRPVPKPLRVISINFPFTMQGVVNEDTLATSLALFDFEVVVVRPHALLPSDVKGNNRRVEWDGFKSAQRLTVAKTDELERFLASGGLLVVILDTLETYTYKSQSYLYTAQSEQFCTNYDFLDKDLWRCIRNGTGNNYTLGDIAEPFAKVLKQSQVMWTAYIHDVPQDPFDQPLVFARNGARAFVGAKFGFPRARIVVLPNFITLDEREFLEACRAHRFGQEATPPPVWVSRVYLPGQQEAESKVLEADRLVKEAQGRKEQAIEGRESLLAYKELLYEKGKARLEPIVIKALNHLGFDFSGAEIIQGTNFEIDGRTKLGSVPGILEIKGSKNIISLDEFSPLPIKILEDFKQTGTQSKGILIGNGLCTETPQQRLGNKIFSPHVLKAAATSSVALVNTTELYAVVCGILSGEITDFEPIRGAILGTSGYVDLARFCKRLPFTDGK
jgi:hypothetical protein